MKEFIRRLVILIIGLAIFIGIPAYFNTTGLLMLSWIPALVAMTFLDE